MRKTPRLLLALAAVLAGLGFSLVAVSGPASATPTSIPWTDPGAKGYIGFCNAQNQQIRSGSIDAYPFAVKVVSSVKAPTGYGAPYGRAILYAYQPIQYVDPGDWSGKQMSGASAFTSDAHPMVQGLPADPALINFSQAFPLHYQGLAQLRMYFSAPNSIGYESSYPQAAVQVVGNTWTQVGGGSVDCAQGKAISDEGDLPIAHKQLVQGGQPKARSNTFGPTYANGLPPASATGSGAPGSSNGSGSGPAGSSATSGAAAASGSHSASSTGVVIGVLAAALVAAGAGFVLFRRRQAGNHTPPADVA